MMEIICSQYFRKKISLQNTPIQEKRQGLMRVNVKNKTNVKIRQVIQNK